MTLDTIRGFSDPRGEIRAKRRLFTTQSAAKAQDLARLFSNINDLTKIVERAGREALLCSGRGWYPESDIRVVLGQGKPLLLKLSGFKRLEMSVNPAIYLEQCRKLHAAGVGPNPITILENTAGALVRLFAGYYAICPWDAWRHKNLVCDALWGGYGSQWVSPTEREFAAMVTLFFEKSVVSHALTEAEGQMFVDGLVCERVVNQAPYQLLTALFERLQAMLFPESWKHVLKTVPREPDPLADALVPNVMFLLFDGRVRSIRGRIRLMGKTQRPKSWEWGERVERLANLLIPYLERIRDEGTTSPSPNPFVGLDNGRDGGDPDSISVDPGAQPMIDPDTVSHPFVGGDDGELSRSEIEPHRGGFRPGTGPPRPPQYDDFEAIDRHYSQRADLLVLRDKSEQGPKREPERITVGYLDCEEASLLDLVSGNIDWSRCRKGKPSAEHPNGLRLYRRTEPIDVPAGDDAPGPNKLPHLLVVVDSSGSMNFKPQAVGPGRGKYDIVLMAAWGMFRYIQSCENTDRVQVNALNFSSATVTSGWHSCGGLTPVKKVLARYFGGGTTLDVAKLREAFDSSPGEFLTVVITDGGLSNAPAAVDGFRDIVRAGNHLVLLHIGEANAFTQGIRKLGCPTHLLSKAEDLVGLCLDLAKSRYTAKA